MLYHVLMPYSRMSERAKAALALHVLGAQRLHRRRISLLEVRFLFCQSFRPVLGLTCNPRAVSRMPLAVRALSTLWRLPSGACPADVSSRSKARPRSGQARPRSRCWPSGVGPWRPLSVPGPSGHCTPCVLLVPHDLPWGSMPLHYPWSIADQQLCNTFKKT